MSRGAKGNRRPKKAASPDEVARAVEGLGAGDVLRLKKAAERLVQVLPDAARSGDDLYQEAIVRMWDGRRRWYQDVPLPRFHFWAMKSIVSDWAKKKNKEQELLKDDTAVARALGPHHAPPRSHETPAHLSRATRLVFAQFHGYEVETALLRGWALGMKGPDICEELGISAKAYDAARKRIARNFKSREKLFEDFADDPTVTVVLLGLELGMTRAAICTKNGLREEEYDAAIRRIARRPEPPTKKGKLT